MFPALYIRTSYDARNASNNKTCEYRAHHLGVFDSVNYSTASKLTGTLDLSASIGVNWVNLRIYSMKNPRLTSYTYSPTRQAWSTTSSPARSATCRSTVRFAPSTRTSCATAWSTAAGGRLAGLLLALLHVRPEGQAGLELPIAATRSSSCRRPTRCRTARERRRRRLLPRARGSAAPGRCTSAPGERLARRTCSTPGRAKWPRAPCGSWSARCRPGPASAASTRS